MGLQQCGLNLNRAGREMQPHGLLEFPCAGYSACLTEIAEDIIPWHWHEELEIVYVAAGDLEMHIRGKTFRLGKGQALALNSNALHRAAAKQRCELHSLVFHPLLVTGDKESVFAKRYLSPLLECVSFDGCVLNDLTEGNLSPADEFASAFEVLATDAPGYEFIVREKLSSICLSLFRRYEREIAAGGAEPDQESLRIRQMLDYIHEHFSCDLRLSHIARAGGVGERECLRCFRRTIRMSPVQYLLKYRAMRGASMLLRDVKIPVSDIAGECGFESPSNFAHIFKRFFKCTPREYRKSRSSSP